MKVDEVASSLRGINRNSNFHNWFQWSTIASKLSAKGKYTTFCNYIKERQALSTGQHRGWMSSREYLIAGNMYVKMRIGFVTNSSSSFYRVKNTSYEVKTMLDLLNEAAMGEWHLMKQIDFEFPSPKEIEEAVEKLETFFPGSERTISIAWGEGEPIYCPAGLDWGSTDSFHIQILE